MVDPTDVPSHGEFFRLGLWCSFLGILMDDLRVHHGDLALPDPDRLVWKMASWIKNYGLLGAVVTVSSFSEEFFGGVPAPVWHGIFMFIFMFGAWLQLRQVMIFQGTRFWRMYLLVTTVWFAIVMVGEMYCLKNGYRNIADEGTFLAASFSTLRLVVVFLLIVFPSLEVVRLHFFALYPNRFSVTEHNKRFGFWVVKLMEPLHNPLSANVDNFMILLAVYPACVGLFALGFVLYNFGLDHFIQSSVCSVVAERPDIFSWLGVFLGIFGELLDEIRTESTHLAFPPEDRLMWKVVSWLKNWGAIGVAISAPFKFYYYFPEPNFHTVTAAMFQKNPNSTKILMQYQFRIQINIANVIFIQY